MCPIKCSPPLDWLEKKKAQIAREEDRLGVFREN
jgi:hypothetical protein